VNSHEIEAAADAWFHRKDVGPWDEAAASAFECWLAESPRHRVAYLRLEHAWDRAERLKALRRPDGEIPPVSARSSQTNAPVISAIALPGYELGLSGAPTPKEKSAPSPRSRAREELVATTTASRVRPRPRVRWSLAATVALTTAAALFWFSRPLGTTYSTAIGAVESVPIADGSTITLNTATRVRVDLSQETRRVDLERGEALFEVAHDPNRPFVVHAGNKRVIAVGTKFSVRREGENIQVVVTEGKVRIEGDRGVPAARAELATAGTVARAGDNDIVLTPVSLNTAEESLSWRRGILVFHDTALADAVAELNRYNAVQITIEDDATARLPIAGEVRATNVDAFVRIVEQAYHLRAERGEVTIALRPISP
jgi:transmembrane sensor